MVEAKARLVATDLRKDKLYVRVYLICLNFLVQILFPFISLIALNFLTYRTIKESEATLLQNIRFVIHQGKNRMLVTSRFFAISEFITLAKIALMAYSKFSKETPE